MRWPEDASSSRRRRPQDPIEREHLSCVASPYCAPQAEVNGGKRLQVVYMANSRHLHQLLKHYLARCRIDSSTRSHHPQWPRRIPDIQSQCRQLCQSRRLLCNQRTAPWCHQSRCTRNTTDTWIMRFRHRRAATTHCT